VGAELSAALAASRSGVLSFFPAFPDMKRTTKNGVQYYDGVPIHESVLANDPFDPISSSSISKIISSQSQTTVVLESDFQHKSRKDFSDDVIVVYDGETNHEMDRAVSELARNDGLSLMAGCAGLASIVQPYLQLKNNPCDTDLKLEKPILFVCGSINPVTRKQIAYAAVNGYAMVELNPNEQINPNFCMSRIFQETVDHLWNLSRTGAPIILASNPQTEMELGLENEEVSLKLEQRRVCIAENLSMVLKTLLDMGLDYTFMISGGDVALAFIQQIGCTYLKPEGEIAPGTVVSKFYYGGNVHQLISKSGGFGKETLLVDMNSRITRGGIE